MPFKHSGKLEFPFTCVKIVYYDDILVISRLFVVCFSFLPRKSSLIWRRFNLNQQNSVYSRKHRSTCGTMHRFACSNLWHSCKTKWNMLERSEKLQRKHIITEDILTMKVCKSRFMFHHHSSQNASSTSHP